MFSIVTNLYMVFVETVCCENNFKHTNILSGKIMNFLLLELPLSFMR